MKHRHAIGFWLGLLAFGLLGIGLTGCQPAPPELAEPLDTAAQQQQQLVWQPLLSESPAHWISASQPLYYRFNRPVASAEQIGQADKARVKFSPELAVTALWLDAYTLQVTPVETFPAGQTLQLTLNAQGLALDPQTPDWTQTFQVLSQHISLRETGFMLEGDSPDRLSYQFEIHTLDPMTLSTLKPLVEVAWVDQTSAVPQMEWQQLQSRVWQVTLRNLQKKAKPQPLQLRWQQPGRSVEATTHNLVLPALEQFRLLSSRVLQQGAQIFELRFSEALDAKQNLTGLALVNQQQLRSKIHGNVLQLFAQEPFTDQVEISLSRALKSSQDQPLEADQQLTLQVSSRLPALRFSDAGFILPAGDRLLLPLELTNAKAVHLKVFEIFPDNIGQYLQQAGNNWQNSYGKDEVGRYIAQQHIRLDQPALDRTLRYELDVTALVGKHRGSVLRIEAQILPEDSLFACEQPLQNNPIPPLEQLNSDGYYRRDNLPERLWRFYQSAGYYDWSEQQNPCHSAYYYGYQDHAKAAKVFMASNIGLLSKMGQDQQLDVLVTNLQTGQMLAKAEVEVFNYQQQRIGRGLSDANGLLRLKPEGVPYYLTASLGKDRGYLRMPANDSLPTAQFDTQGVVAEQGLKGFFYAERNVWRPGDPIHLMLILQDKTGQLPADFPVTLDLFDPRGQKVQSLVQREQINGFYRFDLITPAQAQTGNWHAVAKVGGSYFDTSLKVENILPNRLKMDLNLPDKPLTLSPTVLKLQASWLQGAVAKGLSTDVELKLKPITTTFDGLSQYRFDDASRAFSAQPRKIVQGKLDEQGQIEFPFTPDINSASPGALQALFIQRVFEPSGQFSTQYRQTTLLPYDRFVGLLPPAGLGDAPLDPSANARFDLVLVSPEGERLGAQSLQLKLLKMRWRWWWEHSDNEGAQYRSEELQAEVASAQLLTDAQGQAHWIFEGKAYAQGRYLLQICDTLAAKPEQNHCVSQQLYLGWGYGDDQQRASATRLELSSDQASYRPGQMAKIQLPAGPARQVLLSLETGSQVLQTQLISLAANQQQFELPITAQMVPNVYAHITQIQPHSGRHNDEPLRSYGILNLNVSDPASHLQPQLQMPAEVAPETEFAVQITEQQGRAMTYTLALVDEGLLGITDFQVPKPHAAFYQREALGVRSWDLFDDVVGAYNADLSRLLAVGGSDIMPKTEGQREQRFKPIVRFLGPFQLAAGATARHTIQLPPYLGAVRAMVVAGDGYAYGQAQQSMQVTQALTLFSTVPRVLGPSEAFRLPVSVFWSESSPVTVKVSIETNDLVQSTQSEQQVQFQGKGEQTVFFDLTAAAATGQAEVKVTARQGDMQATEQTTWPLRSSNPLQLQSISTLLAQGERWQPKAASLGMPGTTAQWLSISTSPDFALERHLRQLQQEWSPWVGQCSAGGLPALYLHLYQQWPAAEKQKFSQQIAQQLQQLPQYQTAAGQFGFWPAQQEVIGWADLFTGHFLLQAQAQGYPVPGSVLNGWLNAQQKLSNTFRDGEATARIEHGWRLWLLVKANKADQGAMNRFRDLLRREQPKAELALWFLALAYAEQGQLDVARDLYRLGGHVINTEQPGIWRSTLLQQSVQLELLALLQRPAEQWALAQQLADQLRQRDDLHAVERSWSLAVLLQQFGQVQGAAEVQSVQLQQNASQTEHISLSLPAYQQALPQYQAADFQVVNQGPHPVYLTLIQQGVPAPGEELSQQQGLLLTTRFYDLQQQPLNPAQIPQGTDFIARVKIDNQSGQDLSDLALQQIFPSGWQLRSAVLAEDQPAAQLDWQHALDDRLSQYFKLSASGRQRSIELDVTLNASFSGRFYLPAWRVSAQLQPAIFAQSQGQWIEVLPNVSPNPVTAQEP